MDDLIFLPKNLSGLTRLAADDEGRHALQAVQVKLSRDAYRVTATDGKVLGVVQGPSLAPVQGKNEVLDQARQYPNGGTEALIPAKDWTAGMKLAKKTAGVGLVLAAQDITFVSFGGTHACRQSEGRYPSIEMILPKKGPSLTVKVNPATLWPALRLVVEMGIPSMEMLFYGPGKPLGLSGKNALGQLLDVLFMPLQ